MRVGIDVSPLVLTRAGTGRYISGLLEHLERVADIELVPLSFAGTTRAATVLRDTVWYLGALPRAARRLGLDVLHCTTFRGPLRTSVPLVVTVHDLAVLRHPDAFNRWTRAYSRVFVPRVVAAARRLIAVSDFTARELGELLGVPRSKVRVIPNGAQAPFAPDGASAKGDYVLTVGTLEPRKNLERLAEATRRLGLELRVVGARGWGGVEARGDGVVWLGEVDDDELARLYRGALCLAYPSLYEGFGIPVLEAMSAGTPVVTSARGAMQELADGAAVLVDPTEPESIAAGIREALARREEPVRLGRDRASRYSWETIASATADVYRELVE